MALIAHWPLNGNTNDISGNNWNGNLMGSPTYTNGKIGQAVSLNGSTQYVEVPTREYLKWRGQEFSVFLWVNLASDDSDGSIISKPWNGVGQYNYRIDNGSNNIGVYLLGTQGYTIATPAGSITKDVWNHIGFTVNSATLRIYINGIKVSETAHGIIGWVPSAGDTTESLCIGTLYPYGIFNQPTHAAKGLYNDVRIFNHVLTDMEVQEIARAKILHYTFDDMQEPTTNRNFNPSSNYWVNSGAWTANYNETDVIRPFPNSLLSIWSGVVTTVGSIHFGFNVTTVLPSTTYTISVWFRQNRAGASSPYMRTNVNNNSLGNFSYNGNTNSASWPVNEWIRISASFTTQANENGIYLSNYIGTQVGDKIWYYGYQVEQKDHVTEYVYGSRTGQVKDYSGFFNHSDNLTEANTLRWIPEAKIGTGAYQFNGTASIIKTLSPKAYIPAAMDYTQSIWVYQTSRPARQVIFDDNNQWEHWIALNPGGTVYAAYYVDATIGQISVTSTNTISLNTWYHIALSVVSGVSMKLYVNGVLWAERTINGYHSKVFNDFVIGSNGGANAEKLIGYLDDARVYSKALTQDEIIDIYQARAEIEESGVLYARDFLSNVEETINLFPNITGQISKYNISQYVGKQDNVGASFNYNTTVHGTYTVSADVTLYPDDGATSPRIGIMAQYSTDPITYSVVTDYTNVYKDGVPRRLDVTVTTDPLKPLDRIYGWVADYSVANVRHYDAFNMQLEYKDHSTPFVSTYRPASQLPSTIEFGADEIHENGIANFNDFSTVGITDGLVGYWPLNYNSKDYSGNNYNGTNYGSMPILDDSTYFNGAVTNYIQLPNSTITNLGDFTFSFFAKFTSISKAINTIFHATNTGGNDLSLEFYSNMIRPILNTSSFFSYNTTNINNIWYHFVIKRTGSTIEVFKDNISLGTSSYPTTIYSITGAIILGHEQDAVGGGFDATQSFEGYLSNFKLFNRALTAEEIAIEYNTMFNNEVQIHESGVLYAKDIKQY